jgi:macrolide transport system ATP-binding/permease protein
LAGLIVGIPVAGLCVRYIKSFQSQLYGVASMDASVIAAVIGTLVVAACLAGLVPARRAASVDPARALRAE